MSNDMYICPSVDTCDTVHKCGHREPHIHKDAGCSCNYRCRLATGICVKVDTCKKCATLRERLGACTLVTMRPRQGDAMGVIEAMVNVSTSRQVE